MPDTDANLSAPAALERLLEGNKRFLARSSVWQGIAWDPQAGNKPQRPIAVVLGCSDSRTPVEILFDQGFGDLFVVRIAGNIVAPSIIGSVEYAVQQFGTGLVLVMGHTRCGAIHAAIEAIETGDSPNSKNVRSITDRIVPNIEELVHNVPPEKRWDAAVRANVRASMSALRGGSAILERKIAGGDVEIVGAEYALETGAVRVIGTLKHLAP